MRLLLIVGLAAVLAACGPDTATSNDPDATPGTGRAADGILNVAPGTGGGPGVSIADAVSQAGQQPLLVNGALFVGADGTVLLCEAIAESFPPQCGGMRLEVRGLDLAGIPGMQAANGVRWVEQTQVLGTVTLVEG